LRARRELRPAGLEKLAKTRLKDVGAVQSALKELRPGLDYDAIFVNFLRGRPVVLGYYFNSNDDAVESGALAGAVLRPVLWQQENFVLRFGKLRRQPA